MMGSQLQGFFTQLFHLARIFGVIKRTGHLGLF